jgi:3-oxoacyl-[acyl-carrier-protein] synthase-3
MSLFIKQKLGATKAIFFDVSNACAGMFTGMYILDSILYKN